MIEGFLWAWDLHMTVMKPTQRLKLVGFTMPRALVGQIYFIYFGLCSSHFFESEKQKTSRLFIISDNNQETNEQLKKAVLTFDKAMVIELVTEDFYHVQGVMKHIFLNDLYILDRFYDKPEKLERYFIELGRMVGCLFFLIFGKQ